MSFKKQGHGGGGGHGGYGAVSFAARWRLVRAIFVLLRSL